MTDLVSLNDDMSQIQFQVVSAKKDKARKVEAREMETGYQDLLKDREEDAALLVKVISQDLLKNNGKPGTYYRAYLKNMKSFSKVKRESIEDVTREIRKVVKHQSSHGKHAGAYKARLKEISKF